MASEGFFKAPKADEGNTPEKLTSPERKLLAAILCRAILDAVQVAKTGEKKKIQWMALQWIEGASLPPGECWEITFDRVCEFLDLDPLLLRKKIRTLLAPGEENESKALAVAAVLSRRSRLPYKRKRR